MDGEAGGKKGGMEITTRKYNNVERDSLVVFKGYCTYLLTYSMEQNPS